MPFDLCNSKKDYKRATQNISIESTSSSTICKQNHKRKKQFKRATMKNKKNTDTKVFEKGPTQICFIIYEVVKEMRNEVWLSTLRP